MEFDETELRELTWDALGVVRIAGGGLFSLLAREFAPWDAPWRGVRRAGCAACPRFLERAGRRPDGLDAHGRFRAPRADALAQLGGIDELINQGIAEADRQVGRRVTRRSPRTCTRSRAPHVRPSRRSGDA